MRVGRLWCRERGLRLVLWDEMMGVFEHGGASLLCSSYR